MHRGWIKSWRKTAESQVFKNPDLFKMWMWCLWRANYKHNWISIKTGRGETQVEVERGQFVFGRFTAAAELDMKPASVARRMKKLQTLGNVSIKPSTHYSIITICNYNDYQAEDSESDQASEQPSSNQVATNEQPTSTEKKVKKVKKEKKEKNIKKQPPSAAPTNGCFDRFWKAYPRKVGKKKALAAWDKVFASDDPPDPEAVIAAAELHGKVWDAEQRSDKRKPHPTTWLNGANWTDEIEIPPPEQMTSMEARNVEPDYSKGF